MDKAASDCAIQGGSTLAELGLNKIIYRFNLKENSDSDIKIGYDTECQINIQIFGIKVLHLLAVVADNQVRLKLPLEGNPQVFIQLKTIY